MCSFWENISVPPTASILRFSDSGQRIRPVHGVCLGHVFPQTVAVTFHVDDPAVMEWPVQDGGGDDRVAEQLLSVSEAFIGGDRELLSFLMRPPKG